MNTIECNLFKENDILVHESRCDDAGNAAISIEQMMRFISYKCVVEQEVKGKLFTMIVDPTELRKLT